MATTGYRPCCTRLGRYEQLVMLSAVAPGLLTEPRGAILRDWTRVGVALLDAVFLMYVNL